MKLVKSCWMVGVRWRNGFHRNVNCISRCLSSESHKTFKSSDMELRLSSRKKSIPDHSTLKFGHTMTDNMLEIHWNSSRGWGKPLINEYHSLSLDPAAKCLHYSLEIFEGTKAFYGKDGKIRLFRPLENCKRMNNSATRSSFPNFDNDELRLCLHKFVEVEKDWVPRAEGCALYLRPTMIGTEPTLGVSSSSEVLLYVIASPVGPYFPTGMKPVSLLADPKYVRAWPGGVGNSKVGSNYGPTVHIQAQALTKGCQQVLWLFGPDHLLTEAGTMNIFVRLINKQGENELVTPPLDQGVILPGVVRKSILELVRKWSSVKVSEREITMHEICEASKDGRLLEMFGSGTACVVNPVERILYNGKDVLVPTMKTPNPIYAEIYKQVNDIFYGRTESPWSEVVCSV